MIEIIDDFASRQPGGGALTVTRTQNAVSGTYDSQGRKVAGTTTTIPIIALVVPTNGRDLTVKADHQVTSEIRALLTTTALRTRDDGFAPDTLVGTDLDGDGVPWTVFHWEIWPSPAGETFYRALVARGRLE